MNQGLVVRDAQFVHDGRDDEIKELAGQVRDLQAELRNAKREMAQRDRESSHAIAELRRQLTPLYRALQAVFGEIDKFATEDAPNQPNSRHDAVWDAWKSKIGGQPAQLIDAFRLHGEMTSGQIAIAIGISPKNVASVVHKLNKAGLIQKNGNKFSLKSL